MKVLIIDDREYEMRQYVHIVTELGHEVTEAVGGREATLLIEDTDFDAIITDVQMPRMTGVHVLQSINWGNPSPPHCLIHSSSDSYRERGSSSELDLKTIGEIFEFAEFHHKRDEKPTEYIPTWLQKISQ